MENRRGIGPYRLLEPLGQGGMGVVYRGTHEETGHLVALKTVRLPHPELLQGIRREIQTLALLRHPGIVPIVAEGVEDGIPWYAMELIQGATLRRHALALRADSRDQATLSHHELAATVPMSQDSATPSPAGGFTDLGPPDPEAFWGALGLVRRLCGSLAFLHGEGLVHRDLKPENVLIREADGAPILMDFGLSSKFGGQGGREALEVGAPTGTIAYMAPEQIRGELLDARADLYSLGCILYELATGRRPFLGSSDEILRQHLETPPPPASTFNLALPEGFDALLARLLAKEPHERLGYAADVAAILERLGVPGESAWSGAPEPRPYLYRPRLAGRDDTLSRLLEPLALAGAGSGQIVLLGGEGGVGKTRMAMELARAARLKRMRILTGQCLARGSPFHALRQFLQALADRCRPIGASETARLLGPGGRLLSLYESSLASLPGLESALDPSRLQSEPARALLFDTVARALAGFVESQALLIVLDDLHWADELTLGLLEFLAGSKKLAGLPVLLLGTYRTDEVSAPLERLLEQSGIERERLSRLDEAAVSRIVQDSLALRGSAQAFVRFLTEQSEGNPFFVMEFLRTALSEGLLSRDAEGRWRIAEQNEEAEADAGFADLPLPSSLRELIGRRLAGLPSDARRLAEAASVLGREVDFTVLGRLEIFGVEELLPALSELLRRQVIEATGPGELRFVHERLRESVYDSIEPPRRERLHRQAAGILEAQSPESVAQLDALGRHWEGAGDLERAAAAYLGAARKALELYARDEALQAFKAYFELRLPVSRERLEARVEFVSKVLAFLGGEALALEHLETALEEALALGVEGWESRIRRLQGNFLMALGRVEAAEERFERILSEALESCDCQGQIEALHGLANLSVMRGQLTEAQERYRQALGLARKLGLRDGESCFLGNMAAVAMQLREKAEALRLFEEALALKQELRDRAGEGIVLLNLASLYMDDERPELARSALGRALEIKRQTSDRKGEVRVLLSLGNLDLQEGAVAAARRGLLESVELAGEVGARHLRALALAMLANLESRSGQLERAASLLDESEPQLRQLEDWINVAGCLFVRCRLASLGGDQEAARGFFAQAEQLAARFGFRQERAIVRGLAELASSLE